MKLLMISILFVFCSLGFSRQAFAQEDLLMDGCADSSIASAPALMLQHFSVDGADGPLSCHDLRAIDSTLSIIKLALIPASFALRDPSVGAALSGDLLTAGLTIANPAVLGVTVVGAVGVVTFYVVLKQSLEDCARQDRDQLKQEILNEVQARYGASGSSNTPISIGH